MGTVKISNLIQVNSLNSADVIPTSDTGANPGSPTTYKVTVKTLANSMPQVSSSISASNASTASFVTGSIHTGANPALTASYALSASYAPSSNSFPYSGSARITGSLGVTGSVSVTGGGFTGSLLGTSSWATNAVSAQTASRVSVTGLSAGSTSYLVATLDSTYGAVDKQFGTYQTALTYDGTAKTLNVTSSWSSGSSWASTSSVANQALVGQSNGDSIALATWGNAITANSIPNTLTYPSTVAGTAQLFYSTNTRSINATASFATTASYATSLGDLNQNLTITGSLTISGSPSPEIKVLGEMTVTGSLVVSGSNGAGIFSQGATLVDYTAGISSTGSYMVWRAPFSCSVVALYGYYLGGSAPSVNALRSGSSGIGRIVSSDLQVNTQNVWTAASTANLQNKDFNAGDALTVIMTGSANNQLAVQVDFIRKF